MLANIGADFQNDRVILPYEVADLAKCQRLLTDWRMHVD